MGRRTPSIRQTVFTMLLKVEDMAMKVDDTAPQEIAIWPDQFARWLEAQRRARSPAEDRDDDPGEAAWMTPPPVIPRVFPGL